MTKDQAIKAVKEMGLTPHVVVFFDPPAHWGKGQVQSVETFGPATFGHPRACISFDEE